MSPVRITATPRRPGPNSITRWWPSRSDRTPKIGDSDELGEVERRREEADGRARRPRGPPCSGQLREVDGQHRSREAGAEAERERAADDGPQGTIHRARSVAARPARRRRARGVRCGPVSSRRGSVRRRAPWPASRSSPIRRRTSTPREAAGGRDPHRPADRDLRPTSYRAGVDLSTADVLGADDRAGRAVPEDRGLEPGRLQGDLRRGVRRRAPTRSSRSMSPARCRARSRAPRSRRAMLPGPRDPHRRLAGRVDGRRRSSLHGPSRWPRRRGRPAEIAES